MTAHDYDSIELHLRSRQDGLDPQREALVRDLEAGVPDARERVFGLANALWMRIATAAWNDGDRTPRTLMTCSEVSELLDWAIDHEPVEDAPRFDLGGCWMTKAMAFHVLGRSEEAVEILREIAARPVNAYFHQSGSEKLARVLVDLDRTDEAMVVFHALRDCYPENDWAQRCIDAFSAEQNQGPNGFIPEWAMPGFEGDAEDDDEPVDHGAMLEAHKRYETETTERSARFQTEMMELMQAGLDPGELASRMAEMQAEFQRDMEELSRMLA